MIKARTAFAIAILLAVLLPLTMMAQTEAPPPQGQGQGMGEHHGHMGRMGEPSGQAHLDHLSRMLSLTDEQKAKVKPILDDVGAQALKILVGVGSRLYSECRMPVPALMTLTSPAGVRPSLPKLSLWEIAPSRT